MRLPGRHLPPVHSPVPAAAAVRALLYPGARGHDASTRLEALLADRFEADAVALCGSGTEALQLALRLARDSTGRDTAGIPAYTCYDMVTAAVGARVRPAFYDLDPDTLLPRESSLNTAVAARPAAVVMVHHFGIPTPLDEVSAAVASAGAWLIEDAAQAQGGRWNGRRLGSLAPMSILSFGRGKGWTGGGGGALLLRGDAAKAFVTRVDLSTGGSGSAAALKLAGQWVLGRPGLYALPAAIPAFGLGETRYRPPSIPTSMPRSIARLVLAAESAAETEVETRRVNARVLRARLQDVHGLRLVPERGEPGYLRLPLRVPGRDATAVLPGAAARLGLLPSYPRALPELDAAGQAPVEPGSMSGARALARELFTAPTHSFLRARDLDRIEQLLRSLT